MPGPDPVTAIQPWERRVLTDPPSVVGTLRRELVAYARSAGATAKACDAVALAISEALTNVVRHAYVGEGPGPMMVEAHLEGDAELVVQISDEGLGPIPRGDSPGLGLGLGLMAQMADDFSISNRHDARGTVVSLRFSLRSENSGGDAQVR